MNMSDVPQIKHDIPWSTLVRGGGVVMGFLAMLILNDMRTDVKELKGEMIQIMIHNQKTDDRVENNANAINELKHTTDYLQKVKKDK